jgi:hypothetical protein
MGQQHEVQDGKGIVPALLLAVGVQETREAGSFSRQMNHILSNFFPNVEFGAILNTKIASPLFVQESWSLPKTWYCSSPSPPYLHAIQGEFDDHHDSIGLHRFSVLPLEYLLHEQIKHGGTKAEPSLFAHEKHTFDSIRACRASDSCRSLMACATP